MTSLFLAALISSLTLGATDPPHIKAAMTAYQQGKAALRSKQPMAAAELLNKAIAIEPTFVEAYKELIEAHLASGNKLDAAALMTRLLEIDSGAIHYRLLLAQTLLGEKQWNRSLAQFALVLRDDPFNADALWGFAAAAKSLGLEDRAADALAKGRGRYPDDQRFRTP